MTYSSLLGKRLQTTLVTVAAEHFNQQNTLDYLV